MSLLLYATALFAIAAPSRAAVTLNVNLDNGDTLTPLKSGATLSGETKFKITVDSKDLVTQVEFYFGDDLRDSATATPYRFKLDTLAEKEGDVKLRFKAYTSAGDTGEKSFEIHIDNGVSKGASFHIQRGQDLLADSKFDQAFTEGRIARMADPASIDALLIMSRAQLGKNTLDQAQKYADDALAKDPKAPKVLDLIAVINLKRAFLTVNTGGDKTETRNTIRDALAKAVQSRRQVLDQAVDTFGDITPDNLTKYADVCARASRFTLAINTLQPVFDKDQRRTDVGNRLAYNQLEAGRLQDAYSTVQGIKKAGQPDAYTYGLLAELETVRGNDSAADDAIREGLLADSENMGIRTAQAFIALMKNKTSVLAKLTDDLRKDEGQRPEVNYFVSALYNRQQHFNEGQQYYERAVLAEPANAEIFIEQANQAIYLTTLGKLEAAEKTRQYEQAKMYYQTALVARPESATALTGLAVVALFQKNYDEATKYANAATLAEPLSATAHYGLAGVMQMDAQSEQLKSSPNMALHDKYADLARVELAKASQLDQVHLGGRTFPNPEAIWRYLNTSGRDAVISAPHDEPKPAGG